jgi:ATP-dependent protease ClpP protease subunit
MVLIQVDLLAKHTGQSRERIEEDVKRPKYFTPTEAIEYGLIDKVHGQISKFLIVNPRKGHNATFWYIV